MKEQENALIAAVDIGDVVGVKNALLNIVGTHANAAAPHKVANPNQTDDTSLRHIEEALHRATCRGHTDIVRLILAAGFDIHVAGSSVLCAATFHGHAEIVRLLLTAGIDVHADDDRPLHVAAAKGHADIVRIFLAAGANVHADHDEALCTAATMGHVEIVRLLLAAGANVHAKSDRSVFRAACYGHAEVVRVLLAAGADPVAVWAVADKETRAQMIKILDTCADAMTPEQRAVLAKTSKKWVRLRAIAESETDVMTPGQCKKIATLSAQFADRCAAATASRRRHRPTF